MCGRLDIMSSSLSKKVSDNLNIQFFTADNRDLRPTQTVSTITSIDNRLQQLDTSWGIKPSWAKKLLINAQAESVSDKPTFRKAFANHRCVVPCSGWYEWSSTQGNGKQKYLFGFENQEPIYMAGIWYTSVDEKPPQLVTLTTTPIESCKPYHHRMPLLIPVSAVEDWLKLSVYEVIKLLASDGFSERINVSHNMV